MAKHESLPKEIIVYECDKCEGEPIYGVARNVEEIPEDCDGEAVGIFTLNQVYTFNVKRFLK